MAAIPIMKPTKEYSDYIKSPRWKAKRQQYFNSRGKYCRGCGKRYGTIQLHHLTYDRLGREKLADLVALCASCHKEVTSLHYKMGKRTPGIIVYRRFLQIKRGHATRKR